ncbi:MAG: hypothetical protein HFH87_00610 [Lachnospiraceae bacterium]|nr:hypothetical protein [Lachnospiraceae bacterium]
MVKEKVPWGTYAKLFWRFYRSGEKKQKKEFPEEHEAWSAQKAMLNLMSRKHIYDVIITRRRNVLYLEKTGVKGC